MLICAGCKALIVAVEMVNYYRIFEKELDGPQPARLIMDTSNATERPFIVPPFGRLFFLIFFRARFFLGFPLNSSRPRKGRTARSTAARETQFVTKRIPAGITMTI
jgi:hypothetical protein